MDRRDRYDRATDGPQSNNRETKMAWQEIGILVLAAMAVLFVVTRKGGG